ncbi:MAG: hypothetical protein H6622_01035 [Halobacteriovoraceae bacterium]|nr:hypothetical protein [Halobacteriovoraceae bacterium]
MKMKKLLACLFVLSAILGTSCGVKKSTKSKGTETSTKFASEVSFKEFIETNNSVFKGHDSFGIDIFLYFEGQNSDVVTLEVRPENGETPVFIRGKYLFSNEKVDLIEGQKTSDGSSVGNFGVISGYNGDSCFILTVSNETPVSMCRTQI